MNKSKMIIAAFAVLVASAVSARAGEVIDFDGKSARTVSFAETLNSVEAGQAEAIKFKEVAPDEIPGRAALVFTEKQVKEMDKSIGTAVAYAREQKLPNAFAASLTCLIQKGTPEQKAEFVYQTKGGVYAFPAVCTNQDKGICTWVTQKVCDMVMDPKTNVSKLVCTVAKVFVCGEVEVEADPPTSGH